jgi:hypothetical protein
MIEQTQNGWNEYSKLVLTELTRLNDNDEKIQTTLNEINERLAKQELLKHEITSIKRWKENMNEIATPSTIEEMKKDVDSLNTFKTIAVTIWTVVQIGFGVLMVIFKG